MNWKRLLIALVIAAIGGAFCAYGTTMIEIPGLVVDTPLLATIFYGRLMIGLLVGLAGGVVLIKGELKNAALRGAILGAIMSVGLGFYGGMGVMVIAGTVYGLIADVLATKFGGE